MPADAPQDPASPDSRQVGSTAGRRLRLASAAAGVVVAGLLVTRLGHGPAAGIVGDALYAVLVYLLVAVVAPGARTWIVAGVALVACTGIELAQLTGFPAILVEYWPPARYLLGTTFQAVDLAAYAAGAVLAHLVGNRAQLARVRHSDASSPVEGLSRNPS